MESGLQCLKTYLIVGLYIGLRKTLRGGGFVEWNIEISV